MGRQLSETDARLYRLCDEALYYLWDPIGVHDIPQARDEYESYLPHAFSLVKSGARDELVGYLTDLVGERMGLEPDVAAAESAARFMLEARAWIEESAAS